MKNDMEIVPWVNTFSNCIEIVRLFGTPWTVAHQASPSLEFSRQESWSGLPFPSPGNLPNPGMEPGSPALQVEALPSEPPGNTSFLSFFVFCDAIRQKSYKREVKS